MCDIILASPSAKFGQPEINLGVIPGSGGTQRLARIIGKSRTMELVLTGRIFNAQEAEKWGVVSRVVPEGEGVVVKEAVEMASVIAGKGGVASIAGKEAVNAAFEMSLHEGLHFERRLFHGLFATVDQKEGTCLCYFFVVACALTCLDCALSFAARRYDSLRRKTQGKLFTPLKGVLKPLFSFRKKQSMSPRVM